MQTTVLGRTGLTVTVAGLGAGGHSRLGMAKHGQDHAASLVRAAWDSGVTFFDTATAYGTQGAVGQGLAGVARGGYVLSTKFSYQAAGRVRTPQELAAALEESLQALRTDYIDVYHLHGVAPEHFNEAVERLYPALQKAREQGKIRFIGITEAFGRDTSHIMLKRALPQDLFDVVMVGYNLLNPSAAKTVFPLTLQNQVGVLCMFAVRSALSNPEQLAVDIAKILEHGQADPDLVRDAHALDFLTQEGVAESIMQAAYRYCRHTDGVHVTLTGTGNKDHLADNLASLAMPPLPGPVLARLEQLFGRVDCVSCQ